MGNWMLRGSLVMAAALLLGASACGSDDPVIEDDDDGSTSSSSATSGAGGAGGAGGNGATSSSTTTGGQGGMGQGGMGQGGASMACEAAPNDTVCITCAKDNCCMQIEQCELNMDCKCVGDCVLGGGDLVGCATQCNVNFMNPPPGALALYQCAQGSCGTQCGL